MTIEFNKYKGTLRGICGVCGHYDTQIANEFSGGYYYQRVCDGCWYEAHPNSPTLPRSQRNCQLEGWMKPGYQAIFDRSLELEMKEGYTNSDYDQLMYTIRQYVTNHWNSMRTAL